MNKKTYRPVLFLSIMIPIAIVLIGLCSYYLYELCFLPNSISEDIMLWERILYVIISSIAILYLLYALVKTIIKQRIELDDNEIFVPQNTFIKRQAYQFEVHIPYVEIADISCKYSTMSSKKTPDPNRPKSPRKWAIITLKDGKTKRFSLGYYTPKHSARILDDIILRCAEVGNAINVPSGEVIVANRRKTTSKNKSKK